MDKKEEIIAEIRRVASRLNVTNLTQKAFAGNSRINPHTVINTFGSWNRAVEAAGLKPIRNYIPEHHFIPDDALMAEVIRLTKELGKRPTDREMNAVGKFSSKPYCDRWGTFTKGREVAYQKLGYPKVSSTSEAMAQESILSPEATVIPQTIKPKASLKRQKVQFGEPLDFHGLRFAPINEQGVVYLFGMISRELGFLIESIRTEYPDCEGKRCVDKKENRWEHVLIEFEYKSSHFKEHNHLPESCDLIVCWAHDWEECPLEVLELRSTIKYL